MASSKRKLDSEEQEIMDSYERGEWQSVATSEELRRYQAQATATLSERSQVSISLSPGDIEVIRKKALEEGISYQTLISNIVHQFVEKAVS
ncbi:MAG: antitoxin [Acidobacteriota bacterium]|nr:antitoxin [Acidobacteriota bacterium]